MLGTLYFSVSFSKSHEGNLFRTEQVENRRAPLSRLLSTFASAVSENTIPLGCSQTVLTEFSNCPPERPSPLGFGPAGRGALVPELHSHAHTLAAMPQRYSHQRRKASTAAARRMERRHRDQRKGNNNNNISPTSSHNHRSKKLAMLSRFETFIFIHLFHLHRYFSFTLFCQGSHYLSLLIWTF